MGDFNAGLLSNIPDPMASAALSERIERASAGAMLFNCCIMRRPIGSENLAVQKRAKLSTALSSFLRLLTSFPYSHRARNNMSPLKYFLLPPIYCEI